MNKKNKKIIYPIFLLIVSLSFAFLSGSVKLNTEAHTADKVIKELPSDSDDILVATSKEWIFKLEDLVQPKSALYFDDNNEHISDDSIVIYYGKEINVEDLENWIPELESDISVVSELDIYIDGESIGDKGYRLAEMAYSFSPFEVLDLFGDDSIWIDPVYGYSYEGDIQEGLVLSLRLPGIYRTPRNKLIIFKSIAPLDESKLSFENGAITVKDDFENVIKPGGSEQKIEESDMIFIMIAAVLEPTEAGTNGEIIKVTDFDSIEVKPSIKLIQEKRKIQ